MAFPGLMKGSLITRAKIVNNEMKIAAALALSNLVKNLSVDKIIPGPFDEGVAETVTNAVKDAAIKTGVCR